jgi:hypothetical protein
MIAFWAMQHAAGKRLPVTPSGCLPSPPLESRVGQELDSDQPSSNLGDDQIAACPLAF